MIRLPMSRAGLLAMGAGRRLAFAVLAAAAMWACLLAVLA